MVIDVWMSKVGHVFSIHKTQGCCAYILGNLSNLVCTFKRMTSQASTKVTKCMDQVVNVDLIPLEPFHTYYINNFAL
jgi:hypothetical protein